MRGHEWKMSETIGGLAGVERIALVRLDNLGDHVLGAGLLPALRQHFPDTLLAQIAPTTVADLYARCPAIDQLIAVPSHRDYVGEAGRLAAMLAGLEKHGKFDLVINPRYAEDYYLAGPLCGSIAATRGRVVGFRQSGTPYAGYDPNAHYGELLEAAPDLHASRYAGAMAAHFGIRASVEPAVWFSEEDWNAIGGRYALDAQHPYVVVGCGASFPFKLPALSLYVHLLRRLTGTWGRRVLLVGATADRPAAATLLAASGQLRHVDSIVGELTLYQLSALLSRAELYIGPDAGPMHMAAAAGAAVIELGWVPANYPASSRGSGSGGRCWAPWTARALTIRPPAASFELRARSPDFLRQTIPDLPTDELDDALATQLGRR
jgi:ADP-heptose:LPS heptosyltransferase